MKIDEVHNCENDYYCQQAENEDVADIVGQLRPRERVQYSPDLDRNANQPLYILVLFDWA